MIKAFHSVGTEHLSQKARGAIFDVIVETGAIFPAIFHVERDKMDAQCYRHVTRSIRAKFLKADPRAWKAMVQIIDAALDRLPEEGHRQTRFTCVDVLAGDLDRVFLGLKWRKLVPNGFVFNAEELLQKGARYRPIDLIQDFHETIKETVLKAYKTVPAAKRALTAALDRHLEQQTYTGDEGVHALYECVADAFNTFHQLEENGRASDQEAAIWGCAEAEFVWDGPLPLDLAIEGWRNSKRVW